MRELIREFEARMDERKARFLSWMLEGEEVPVDIRGAPLMANEPLLGMGQEGLNAEQVVNLLAQPWVVRSPADSNHDYYIFASDHEALLDWCVLTGYLHPFEVEYARAILTMRLLEDE